MVAFLAAPLAVSAHANGVFGPYNFLVVLIEEPFYATNRAGFEFWVREGDRPVEGLDRTLRAEAINSTHRVDLVVEPRNGRGFYDVETDLSGHPFDPGSGGNWTLRLTGTIEGLSVDKSFALTFPGYPRVAAAKAPAAQAPAASAPATPGVNNIATQAPFIAIGGVTAIGAGLLLVRSRRRRVAV